MKPELRELLSRREVPGQTRCLAVRWTDGEDVWISDGYNLPITASWADVSQAIQLLVDDTDDTDDTDDSAIGWRWEDGQDQDDEEGWTPCAIHPVIPEPDYDPWDEWDEDSYPASGLRKAGVPA